MRDENVGCAGHRAPSWRPAKVQPARTVSLARPIFWPWLYIVRYSTERHFIGACIGVPGPIAGAGLPALMALGGLRRAREGASFAEVGLSFAEVGLWSRVSSAFVILLLPPSAGSQTWQATDDLSVGTKSRCNDQNAVSGRRTMRVLMVSAALASSLVFSTGTLAQAQNVSPQASATGGGTATGSGAQQTTTLPGAFTFITRRAGIGPGGFNQLCDDPLDPRVFTNECSAAGIGQ